MSNKKTAIQYLLQIKKDTRKQGYALPITVDAIVDLAVEYKNEADGGFMLWAAEPSEYLN